MTLSPPGETSPGPLIGGGGCGADWVPSGLTLVRAPSATSCVGCVSNAVGVRKACCSSLPTSGIRLLPPIRTITDSWLGVTFADRSARPRASTVSLSAGRISASNSLLLRRRGSPIGGRDARQMHATADVERVAAKRSTLAA